MSSDSYANEFEKGSAALQAEMHATSVSQQLGLPHSSNGFKGNPDRIPVLIFEKVWLKFLDDMLVIQDGRSKELIHFRYSDSRMNLEYLKSVIVSGNCPDHEAT